ncbi:MAG: hypothetical protein NUV34_06190 [Sulfuricaulis sp.]|nr:hypothetical protein [Sulfuricaulis sp.]
MRQQDLMLLKEAARIDAGFAAKYPQFTGGQFTGANNFPTVQIEWNGAAVTAVPPRTNVRFVANAGVWPWIWGQYTMFRVTRQDSGAVFFQQDVKVGNLNGLAYIDRASPATPGWYTFDPDYGNPDSQTLSFEVTGAAQNPNPTLMDQLKPALIIGGIAGAAFAGLMIVKEFKKQ